MLGKTQINSLDSYAPPGFYNYLTTIAFLVPQWYRDHLPSAPNPTAATRLQIGTIKRLRDHLCRGDIHAHYQLPFGGGRLKVDPSFWETDLGGDAMTSGYLPGTVAGLSVPFWFSETELEKLFAPAESGKRGRPPKANWADLKAEFLREVEKRGFPDGDNVSGWSKQADVQRWIVERAAVGSAETRVELDPMSASVRTYASEFMKAAKSNKSTAD